MIVRYAAYLAAWFIAVIVGILGGYLLAKHTGIGYSIWGNEVDGYCGDILYKNKEAKYWYIRMFPCFFWSCIRNPANNLLRSTLSAEGMIKEIKNHGNTSVIYMEDGRKYFFYYKNSGYKIKIGWRFWGDQIKVGEYYKASFVFNP